MKFIWLVVLVSNCFLFLPCLAQQKSAKRGMGWDEKTQVMSEATLQKIAPGVSWVYNWGAKPNSSQLFENRDDVLFLPMGWNGAFNEAAIRTYLGKHPEVRFLLGFNEPNFSSQANMTPAQAVESWPRLEKIAEDFDVQLVAPALNFTGERVGGRTWSPFEWYNEFFHLYPNARVDYLAMHCYMNWAENIDWICNRYFYSDAGKDDLYRSANRSKFPYLVQFLDNYKVANGHYPQMFLTEFCSWEDGVYPYRAGLTEDFQIDQMTQKVQYMEKSPLVAGYAWFMANPSGGSREYPYESIFEFNRAESPLSELGTIYVNMSAFDTTKYYLPDELILAKDYIDASMDNIQVRVRSNSDEESLSPLQIEFPQSAWAAWQIEVPEGGSYILKLHVKSETDCELAVYQDDFHHHVADASISSTGSSWADRQITIPLNEGAHVLYLWNGAENTLLLNELSFSPSDKSLIGTIKSSHCDEEAWYTLQGIYSRKKTIQRGIYIHLGKIVVK